MTIPKLSAQNAALIILAVLVPVLLLRPDQVAAQRNPSPAVAQVGPGSPLPVFVVNDPRPALPEEFTPGSSWRFTTWTVPGNLTFTVTVQKTEGGWAFLRTTSGGPSTPRWYYIPQMPGTWEPQ